MHQVIFASGDHASMQSLWQFPESDIEKWARGRRMRRCLRVVWEWKVWYSCFSIELLLVEQQYQEMSMVASWQRAAFQQELRLMLRHIAGQTLNLLEFELLLQQAQIYFNSSEDEQRCRRLFGKDGQVTKIDIMQLICLVGTRVLHTRLQYVVRLRQSREELLHSRPACFRFWKERMEQRFGHVHQWFKSLCQERDIRRVSLPRFLTHLERMLQDTPHRHCAKTVSLAFEMTCKNQVELSVFMNTILIDTKTSLAESRSIRVKSAVFTVRKSDRYEKSKADERLSTAACSMSKGGFQSMRQIVPARSMSKYMTPKVKIKTYHSFLQVE